MKGQIKELITCSKLLGCLQPDVADILLNSAGIVKVFILIVETLNTILSETNHIWAAA